MPTRLHIGAGPLALAGWINIDNRQYPGVDRVLDVRDRLPFQDVSVIFAEHFIEHLTLSEGRSFLRECRRVLAPNGILRLSTPNLDWTWSTHYRNPATLTEEQALYGCFELNRAFHGWGHKFLYNFSTLSALLRHCGFDKITRCAYGESPIPELRNLEQHEQFPDFEGMEAVMSLEASGYSEDHPDFGRMVERYLPDFVEQ